LHSPLAHLFSGSGPPRLLTSLYSTPHHQPRPPDLRSRPTNRFSYISLSLKKKESLLHTFATKTLLLTSLLSRKHNSTLHDLRVRHLHSPRHPPVSRPRQPIASLRIQFTPTFDMRPSQLLAAVVAMSSVTAAWPDVLGSEIKDVLYGRGEDMKNMLYGRQDGKLFFLEVCDI
jgi:hypothetical protein